MKLGFLNVFRGGPASEFIDPKRPRIRAGSHDTLHIPETDPSDGCRPQSSELKVRTDPTVLLRLNSESAFTGNWSRTFEAELDIRTLLEVSRVLAQYFLARYVLARYVLARPVLESCFKGHVQS